MWLEVSEKLLCRFNMIMMAFDLLGGGNVFIMDSNFQIWSLLKLLKSIIKKQHNKQRQQVGNNFDDISYWTPKKFEDSIVLDLFRRFQSLIRPLINSAHWCMTLKSNYSTNFIHSTCYNGLIRCVRRMTSIRIKYGFKKFHSQCVAFIVGLCIFFDYE